jgi:beta-mannosidase
MRDMEREPESLEEFVQWSQERQRRALEIAVSTTKAKFPRCGGILLWMGHDCFPCTANTAVIDFDGQPKPAALSVGEIFRAGSDT